MDLPNPPNFKRPVSGVNPVDLHEYETIDDVKARFPYFIEEVYNPERLHSAPGYMPSFEFEEPVTQPGNARTI